MGVFLKIQSKWTRAGWQWLVIMEQFLRKVNRRPKSKLGLITKVRNHPRKKRTHKQTMDVIRNSYLEYVKSAYKSIIKR